MTDQSAPPFAITCRVYYEDTDMAGIVYYANYLKFIERARSDWVRAIGIDQGALKRDHNTVFAARHIEADWLAPAHLDDELRVTCVLHQLTGARVILDQEVLRGDQPLFTARVTLVCVGPGMRPTRLPAQLRALMRS